MCVLRHTLAIVMLLAAALVRAQAPPAPELASGWTPKDIVYSRHDMVAAANPLAVAAGNEILAMGGSAVDAAIAVQMVLNLVEPQSSGLGGGAFLLTYAARTGAVEMYDGRETAPAAATEGLFLRTDGTPMAFMEAVIGGRSVGVPGVLRMLELAHAEHGRLPWAALFEPAVRIAEAGFAVSPRLHAALQGANPALALGAATGAYFYDALGRPKAVGTILRNPELAATLRRIAAEGADAFYAGPIARDIVAAVAQHPTNPGAMSLRDLAEYRARKRVALCAWYRMTWEICGPNMPSSGGAGVLMTLGILETFDLPALAPESPEAVHLVSEAYRLVYADRAAYMADADFVCVPVAGLLDRAYLHARARQIDATRSMGAPAPGAPAGCATVSAAHDTDEHGTTHVSIVDRDGNAVSMTTTIESAFGSYQMVRGFLLNNQLTDFSFLPRDAAGRRLANRVEAGKRPRSTMAPTLVFDKQHRLYAVLGSPGGSQIVQYVVKTLVGLLDWGLDIQQAIDLPNFGAQTTAVTDLERGTDIERVAPALRALGHTVRSMDMNSGVQGITRFGGRSDDDLLVMLQRLWRHWAGGADPRREGVAAGD